MIPLPNLGLDFGQTSAYQSGANRNDTNFGNVSTGGTVDSAFWTAIPGTVSGSNVAVKAFTTAPVIIGAIAAAYLLFLYLRKRGKV